jgi:YD repeat-containing protein
VQPLTKHDPRHIGPYRLTGRFGTGGMGTVFVARDAHGTDLAVKVVHDEYSSERDFRTRFAREVDLMRRVLGDDVVPWLERFLTEPEPLTVPVEEVDRAGGVHRYEWDDGGRLVKRTFPDETSIAVEWDPLGRPTAAIQADGGRITYTYTPAGRLQSAVTAEGRTLRFTYDAAGRLASSTDADGNTTQLVRDSATGAITAVQRPHGALPGKASVASQLEPLGSLASRPSTARGAVTMPSNALFCVSASP